MISNNTVDGVEKAAGTLVAQENSWKTCGSSNVVIAGNTVTDMLAVGARVEYEVERPDVSRHRRRLRPRAMDRHSSTGALARHLQPSKTPQPPGLAGAHRVTLPPQKDLDAVVTITRILRRQDAHRCQHRRVPHGEHRFVMQRRADDRH